MLSWSEFSRGIRQTLEMQANLEPKADPMIGYSTGPTKRSQRRHDR